jgi:hypothetical protein
VCDDDDPLEFRDAEHIAYRLGRQAETQAAKTVAKRAAKVTSASAEHSGSVTPEPRWRSRASDPATRALRARADERNERFLAAALELLSKGESDLSVRDVVELSQCIYARFVSMRRHILR